MSRRGRNFADIVPSERAYPGFRFASSGLRSLYPLPSFHPCYHGEALDALVAVGIEEGVVVLERNAAVGIAVRTQHVSMREQAPASEDRVLATAGGQPHPRHPVKQRLARRHLIDIRRPPPP